MDTLEERVVYVKNVMVKACLLAGLNLTVYDGKIGFVDQSQRKIVALWDPQYAMNDINEIIGGESNGIYS